MENIKNVLVLFFVLLCSFHIGYSKEVIHIDKITLVNNNQVKLVYDNNTEETIKIDPPLSPNEERTLKVKTKQGLTAEFTLLGESPTSPNVLITSFITKGTKKRPDYVELTFLNDGDAFLYTIKSGKYVYTFPHTIVKAGEKITLYPTPTLSANNGEITIYSSSSPFARVLDTVVYTNKNASVNKKGEWEGEGVDSRPSTSVKVFRRKVDSSSNNSSGEFVDTDSPTDWVVDL